MIDRLENLLADITNLKSKLIILVGPPRSGKSELLLQLSKCRKTPVVSVSAMLGRRLLAIPSTLRHLKAADMFHDLADESAHRGLLLLDNIELLFDHALHLNPLELLKHHARAGQVVAVWPGELKENRLCYATKGHPEHQDYSIDGLVPFRF